MQFRLVRTRSIGVAFYARADQELCAMQFRLVRARRIVPCSLDLCGRGEFVNFVKQLWRGVPHNLHSKEP